MTKIEVKSKGAVSHSSVMKRMRLISVSAVLLVCCLAFVGAAGADGNVAKMGDTEYATLVLALTNANNVESTTGATITLLQDVTLGEKLTISGNVTINGNDKTITRADTYTGTLFTVNAGAKLTLDGNLTIDGSNDWTFDSDLYKTDLDAMISIPKTDAEKYITPEEGAPVATAYMITLTEGTNEDARGGTVNLLDVTIKNHYSINSGIVSATKYTKVVLDGAKITHCAATQASGVVVNASGAGIIVVMEGDTLISGNHVGSNHGIFKIYSGTVFTMNEGTVTETTGWNSNGVVVGLYGGTFIMTGGEITHSSSVYGPSNGRNAAIYLHSNSVMEMSGGTIKENTGRSRGGIDSSKATSQLTITGGTVEDNISLAGNGTPDVGGTVGEDKWSITGGTFTQDISEWCTAGFVPVYDSSTGKFSVLDDDDPQAIPAFKMTLVDADGNKGNPETGVSLVKSVQWGKEKVVIPGQAMELEILTNWELSSVPPAITYPLILSGGSNTLTSKGSVFKVGSHIVEEDSWNVGNLTITDGTYIGGANGLVVVTSGTLNITGGTFKASDESEAPSLLKFAEESFDAHIYITGGTFHNFDPTEFVPEGYKAVETGTNVWTVKKIHSITVTSTEGGTVSASAETAVEGTEITLTITPDEGYRVGSFVTSCDVEISSDGKFTMPASDISIEVVFERIPTSYGGGGKGGALSFPRTTTNGGLVDFGSSKVVKALMLPEGSSGSVVLKLDTIDYFPEELETEYTFDISVEKLGEGVSYIHFEISEAKLTALELTAADICAYHYEGEVWTKLPTTYEVKDGIVCYEAETDSFSPFKLVIEKGAAVPKEEEIIPTVPPVEEPEDTPVDKPEDVLQPIEPIEPTEPATPAPLFAVLAGLGAAVLLRRR